MDGTKPLTAALDALSDVEKRRTLDIALAEFGGLKAEVAARVALQVSLSLANLTVTGVVFTINASGPIRAIVVLPILSSCLALFFFDQNRNFEIISNYIYHNLVVQITHLSGCRHPKIFSWETVVRAEQHKRKIFVPYLVAVNLTFFVPLFGSLAAMNPWLQKLTGLEISIWWLGLVLGAFTLLVVADLGIRRKPVPVRHAGG